jgi:hypothetical protein
LHTFAASPVRSITPTASPAMQGDFMHAPYIKNRMTANNSDQKDVPEKRYFQVTIIADPVLGDIEVTKLPPEKLEMLKEILTNLRFSDAYYLKLSTEYNSQTLKYAIEEKQPARVLNNIVRELTRGYPDLDEALP